MAAHRYWRINVSAVTSGTLLSILEMEMRESIFGPNVCAGGVATASDTLAGSSASYAFDGSLRDLSTGATQDAWATNSGALPAWLKYDFGVGVTKDIVAISIQGRQGGFGPGQQAKDYTVEWSDDNSTWTVAWSVTGAVIGEFEFHLSVDPSWSEPSYVGSPYGSHEFWRIYTMRPQTASDAPAIGEIEFRATPGGADQASGGTAVADAVFGAGLEASKAFDNNATTLWSSTDKGLVNFAWIYYQFASPVEVAEFIIKSRHDVAAQTSPRFFALQFADSSSGPWTTVLVPPSQIGWSLSETRTFTDPDFISEALTDVTPNVGDVAGGTAVTLTGAGFTSATGATFDGVAATSFVVVNDTSITCVTPAGAGLIDVVVIRPTTNLTLIDGYTYSAIPAATVDSVTPNKGTVAGGTAVTIAGDDFTGATGATFNGNAGTSFVVVNDETITCVTPVGSVGLVDVVVNGYGGDGTLTDGFEYLNAIRATQIPLLVVNLPMQPSHVTQIPLLVVNLPFQGTEITQSPLLTIYTPTPIPLPGPVVPEVPVTEVWEFQTAVNITEGSKEQRAALISNPFVKLAFSALIMNEEDRRSIYQMLFKFIKQSFDYPNYVYSTKLTAAASAAATKLFFNPASTDMREGERIALFNPQLDTTAYYTITTLDSDGANLSSPLTEDIPAYYLVCPAFEFRTEPTVGLSMRSIDGSFALKLQTMRPRSVLRPGSSATLTQFDDFIVLDKIPLADTQVDEGFEQDINWLDNETNAPQVLTNWRIPFVSGTRSYLIHRPTGLDYWRTFADAIKGRRTAFLLPTFRDDMPLALTPALSATVIVSSNIQYFDFWQSKTYQYLRLEREDGSVIYRKVLEVTANYNGDGNPSSVNIKLDANIGGSAGNNLFSKISYANICRLNSDSVELMHDAYDTILTIKVRAVNE